MQWSKLKSRLKDLICPELEGRVDFYLTSYRQSHDGADKVWITVDGEKIFSCKHYPYEWAEASAYYSGLRGEELKTHLVESEIHNPRYFGNAASLYMNLTVQEALRDTNPLIRAFAMIDRRLGKRTLSKLEISDSEHSLVKAFYELRRGSSI